ncbi:MAG: alpha-amylase family glycosyl hydrolase, partial [Chloroflexota bacterium]
VARKGSLGSPYSIADYRAVNPEYGTLDDFTRLADAVHAHGMRLMIDVVYNHTAHDSRLAAEFPGFFHQDADGRPVTTVPDWSDVIDLRHGSPGLDEELISTLELWVDRGVDGFRCDVASIVPPAFWRAAVDRIAARKPGVVWLAESVHAGWVGARRAAGLTAWSDAELYVAGFDLTYDYDIWAMFQAAVRGDQPVARYLELLRLQDCIYPRTYAKMRAVENHDNPRIRWLAPDAGRARAWTAFAAFQPGAFLLYGGQESGLDHTPTLFERDPVDWNGYPESDRLSRLARLKKEPALLDGGFHLLAAEPAVQATWLHPDGALYGVFATGPAVAPDAGARIPVQLPDGTYEDLLGDAPLEVHDGAIDLPADAAILRVREPITVTPLTFDLLDYRITFP